jgi:DNA polymerase III delta subunit
MFYFFHGSDTQAVGNRVRSMVQALLKKRPNAQVFSFDASQDASAIEALLEARGLFEEKHIIVLRGIFSKKGMQEDKEDDENEEEQNDKHAFSALIPHCAESPHIILISEGEVDAKAKKLLEKYAHETKCFEKTKPPSQHNPFALSDALLAKDKKKLWLLLLEARREGTAPEAVAGLLFAGLRSIAYTYTCASAEEAGMKPFPFQKAQQAKKNFSREELRTIMCDLVSCYHEAHRGRGSLETLLEAWVLRLH